MASTQNATPGESGWSALDIASAAQRRKRGSRACLRCRVRKVRCDVTQNGTPCTNCRMDAQPCVIPRRSRKHDSSLQSLPLGDQSFHRTGFALQDANTSQIEAYAGSGLPHPGGTSVAPEPEDLPQLYGAGAERWPLLQESQVVEPIPETLNMAAPTMVGPPLRDDSQADNSQLGSLGAGHPTSSAPRSPQNVPDGGTQAQANVGRPAQPRSRDHVIAICYPFLDTSFISRIPAEDFDYLDQIGCLQTPQRNHLDELVRAYFLYVHPHLPLIDEGKFWETYLSSQPGVRSASHVSFLVFQTMLLVACGFVSSSTIQGLGFSSVRMARTSYYRKAKALYDFDIERSNLSKAQGALLMTYHVPLNEPQINTYWLGIAIHLAKAEGADRYSTHAARDSTRHNQLKRLWWCCMIRDRTMSLGLRRSISIFSASSDKIWPPLTDDDLSDESGRSCVCSASVKVKLIRSLSALCSLCAVLTDILQLLYPADGVHAAGDRVDLLKRVYTYTDELNEWHDTAAREIKEHDQHDKGLNIVVLFTNLLTIYFQSAQAALCNYRIMLTINDPTDYSFERLQTKNELQAALRGIALSLRAIIDADMITYSPVSMVAFLALPSVCYNLDLSSRVPTQVGNRGAGANIYQDFLRVLQLRYEGTDRALDNMSMLMANMNLQDATSPSTARSGSEQSLSRREDLIRPSEKPPAKARNGINMIITEPRKYLQMSQTLDFFLSRGRFPTKEDIPLNLLPLPGEVDRSTGTGSVHDSAAGRTNATTVREYQPQDGTSNLPSQAPDRGPVWTASPPGTIDFTASGVVGAGSAELPMTLTDNPSGAPDLNPDDFSFEDFMTDGPFSGIERLQNMLHTYPAWP